MLLYQSQAHARATAEQYRALGSALPAGGERRGRVGARCAEAKLHLIFCRVTLRCPFPARYLAFSRMEFFDKLYTSMSTSCPDSDLTVVNLNGIPFFLGHSQLVCCLHYQWRGLTVRIHRVSARNSPAREFRPPNFLFGPVVENSILEIGAPLHGLRIRITSFSRDKKVRLAAGDGRTHPCSFLRHRIGQRGRARSKRRRGPYGRRNECRQHA